MPFLRTSTASPGASEEVTRENTASIFLAVGASDDCAGVSAAVPRVSRATITMMSFSFTKPPSNAPQHTTCTSPRGLIWPPRAPGNLMHFSLSVWLNRYTDPLHDLPRSFKGSMGVLSEELFIEKWTPRKIHKHIVARSLLCDKPSRICRAARSGNSADVQEHCRSTTNRKSVRRPGLTHRVESRLIVGPPGPGDQRIRQQSI